jgi:hypothetical protein
LELMQLLLNLLCFLSDSEELISEWWIGNGVEGSGRGLILKVLSQHLSGGTEEINEKPQSGHPVSGRDLNPEPPEYQPLDHLVSPITTRNKMDELWSSLSLREITSSQGRAFWDIVTCSLVVIHRRFRGAYYLHHQGDDGLMMKAASTPKRRFTTTRL